jgi:hypothetical protein
MNIEPEKYLSERHIKQTATKAMILISMIIGTFHMKNVLKTLPNIEPNGITKLTNVIISVLYFLIPN